MSNLPLWRKLACITVLAGTFATAPAHALIITGGSTPGLAFEAELTYSFDSLTGDADLVVDLQNTTSPATLGGFLTAFVLNNPAGKINAVSLTAAPTDWNLLGLDNDAVNGAPFGRFDFGATTFANANSNNGFQGGGNPDLGFAPATSGSFTFHLEGSDLDTLDETSFLSALSVPPGAGQGTQFFAARFRGVPGTEDGAKIAAIPEASTYAALFAGIVLLGWRLRRRLWA